MMASNSDLLKLISLQGDRAATISSINCPKDHNMSTVLVDRDSFYRLCGFGATASSRYLDDQETLY